MATPRAKKNFMDSLVNLPLVVPELFLNTQVGSHRRIIQQGTYCYKHPESTINSFGVPAYAVAASAPNSLIALGPSSFGPHSACWHCQPRKVRHTKAPMTLRSAHVASATF